MNDYHQRKDLMKFIVYQTRLLVSDANGDPSYMTSFDKIIYDFYGVKHFSKRMSEVWDNREYGQLINKIGLDPLLALMRNRSYCNVIRDLVRIDDDIESLKKKMRKAKSRGELKKSLVKEYRYLTKLYDNGMKSLRKRLGIKSMKTAYKRQFKAVKGFINEYSDDYRGNWGGFESFGGHGMDYDPYDSRDPVYDDYDDEDDYNYEDSSELQDFVRMMNGPTRRAPRPGDRGRFPSNDIEEEFDDYSDEYGEYHRNRGFRKEDVFYPTDLEDKVNFLSDRIAEMGDAVNGLLSQEEYDRVNHRDPITHKPRQPIDYDDLKAAEKAKESIGNLTAEIKMISGAVSNLTKAMQGFNEWRQDIDTLLSEIDDEDENVVVEVAEPQIVDNDAMRLYQELNNKYPDVYTTPMEELPEGKDPNIMTREELVDEINNGKPVEVSAEGTVPPRPGIRK